MVGEAGYVGKRVWGQAVPMAQQYEVERCSGENADRGGRSTGVTST